MRISRSATVLCLAFAFLVVLVGCSSPGEKMMEKSIEDSTGGEAEVDTDADGSMRIETEEGTFNMGGGTELPADWPADAAVFPEAQIQYTATVNPATGEPGAVVMLLTEESMEDVLAYYSDQLPADGWAMQGTMQGGGVAILSATKGERTLSLSVSASGEQTSITLAVEGAM